MLAYYIMLHDTNVIMLLCWCVCRQTCLVYVCMYIYIYTDVHIWESKYMIYTGRKHEFVCMYVCMQANMHKS